MMNQKSQAEGHFSFEKQKTFDISKKSLRKCNIFLKSRLKNVISSFIAVWRLMKVDKRGFLL
mgnify:CR=1 FL=1